MEFLFLGTSSGTPTKARNVSALALRPDNSKQWFLVDCGEATQHRLLHTSLSLIHLQAIFITHIHGDHCYGLPGLLASAGMLNRTGRLTVAGPAALLQFMDGVLATTQLRLPYPLEFVNVGQTPAMPQFDGFDVQATLLSHRVPSYAYSFTEKQVETKLDVARLRQDAIPPGPLWGQIQQGVDAVLADGTPVRAERYLLAPRKPRKIIVGGDNDTPALLAHEAEAADVLIHEATYTEDMLLKAGPGPQHSSAKQVAQFASAAYVRNLVLTHFSPRYHDQKGAGPSLADIETEARMHYNGNLFLANDFERFMLDKQGLLSRLA